MRPQSSWWSWRFREWSIRVLVFLLAFLPRAMYPLSRPITWYERAIHFGDALLNRDWIGTYQRYHPGVTTMWLSGIGLKLFAWRNGLSSEQLLGTELTQHGVVNEAVTAGVIPLTLVIALCIVLAHALLTRLTNPKVAFVACCLLAVDPFYVTYSEVLQPDGLLATFMLVSALFLHCYLRESKPLDMALSGVFTGLALLTKTPAFFLISGVSSSG